MGRGVISVCVCVCVSVSVCVFDVREQVIVCTLSIGLLFPEVSSPIFLIF